MLVIFEKKKKIINIKYMRVSGKKRRGSGDGREITLFILLFML